MKEARGGGKRLTYTGTKIRVTYNFSSETMQERREYSQTFKVLREKNHQSKILYSVKLFFKGEREIKTFSDKQKLRECVDSRPALQKMFFKKFFTEKENNTGQKLRST